MESGRKVSRAVFGALLLLGVFWFFLAGILANRTTEKPNVTVSSAEIFKHWKVIGRDKHAVLWDSTFIYVSKRRVPNGPDPIHNRTGILRHGSKKEHVKGKARSPESSED